MYLEGSGEGEIKIIEYLFERININRKEVILIRKEL